MFKPILFYVRGTFVDSKIVLAFFICYSFQDDKLSADLVSRPMANSVEFRHETSQSTAGIVPNVTGPGSSRPLIPSQSTGQYFMLFGFPYCSFESLSYLLMFVTFPNLVSEPGLLGPPVKHDGSFIDRDYDMKKGILNMRHSPDIRGQSSAEPPLISRPPVPAYGSWLVEDDISNRTQTNNWPFAPAKESNVVKSEKHQAQQKQFSHKMEVPVSNVPLSQTPQLKAEEVCR